MENAGTETPIAAANFEGWGDLVILFWPASDTSVARMAVQATASRLSSSIYPGYASPVLDLPNDIFLLHADDLHRAAALRRTFGRRLLRHYAADDERPLPHVFHRVCRPFCGAISALNLRCLVCSSDGSALAKDGTRAHLGSDVVFARRTKPASSTDFISAQTNSRRSPCRRSIPA